MKFSDMNLSKFYFNSFLVAFSAFMGAILSLSISEIFGSKMVILSKIGFSALLFLVSLIIVMFVLYKVISHLGSVFGAEIAK